jgi:hypothetical protein
MIIDRTVKKNHYGGTGRSNSFVLVAIGCWAGVLARVRIVAVEARNPGSDEMKYVMALVGR